MFNAKPTSKTRILFKFYSSVSIEVDGIRGKLFKDAIHKNEKDICIISLQILAILLVPVNHTGETFPFTVRQKYVKWLAQEINYHSVHKV